MRITLVRPILLLIAFVAGATTLFGYALFTPAVKWDNGNITIQEQLGGGSGTLIDGSTSWNSAFEAGLAIWNGNLQSSRVSFAVVRDSSAAQANGNSINNIIFSDTIFGRAFGENTLAVTPFFYNTRTNLIVEADIVFNTKYSWNSYRGNLRQASGGGTLQDIRRVGIHEAGHVLGLDHPDEHGQNVSAIMNANVSNIDTVTADDIAGAQALYGGPVNNGTVAFPPRNEGLDFRNQLEFKYGPGGLRRSPRPTFVDNEGDVIWISEYQRYSVNGCSDAVAIASVMTQIDGNPGPSVCSNAPPGVVNFPPRNLSLGFKLQLEAKYRDGLRRSPTQSTVDAEGAVVWIQEYLRYRVNGCSHGDALAKVFAQIDGFGIQPVCR